ncbi:MAG: asparagine synthase (glutamine-hydrolyzing) [Candidatus Lokiarchaeia archaeon]
MSGVCGFNRENKNLLKLMLESIKHRGLDDESLYLDTDLSIGMRIAILKSSTLKQPIHNENEDIWLLCDGEIYNFLELKTDLERKGHNFNTDISSEIIIHAYEEWGETCFDKFRGVFSLCLYDSRKHLLILARDHIGIRTLYYYFDGEIFIFGSEIKCLFPHKIKREVYKDGFSQYLSLRYVPFNNTLFKGIKRVPNSSYLKFDLKTKQLDIKRYWDFNININKEKSEAQFIQELKNLIVDSVKVRLVKDIPISAFLSGGIDSASVVGVLSSLVDKPLKTFSVRFEEGAPVNETKLAQIVAERNGTEHTEIFIKSDIIDYIPIVSWHNDDLFADAAIIPVYLMGKQVKEHSNFVFTGDGADEVFAGYSVYYRSQYFKYSKYFPQNVINLSKKLNKYIPFQRIRMVINYLDSDKSINDQYMRGIFAIFDLEKKNVIPFKAQNVESLIRNTFQKDLDIVNQFTIWDLKYQLPSQYNVKADRALSAAYLTGRIPFLDRDIVAWSLTVPSNLKLKGTIEKYILRMAMKDYVPPEIIKRKKLGFSTPVNLWLNKGLKELSGDILERLSKRDKLIKPTYVKKIKKQRLNRLFESQAWNLIMFELWYETFIENDGLSPISLY